MRLETDTKGLNFAIPLLPVLAALLVILSLPSFDLGFLAWCGLAPFLFALRQKGLWGASCLGFLFGGVFGTGAFFWLLNISHINIVNFLLMIFILSLYFLVYGFFYRLISRKIGSWIIVWAPALWVVLEYVRSNLFFLALPWNLIGHSQYHYLPVIQIADITGVYGISFILVMVNQLLSEIPDFLNKYRPATPIVDIGHSHRINWAAHIIPVGMILVIIFSYGWYRLTIPESKSHLRIAIVQANVLTKNNMSIAEQITHMKAYERLVLEAAVSKPHLIIWPASSLPAQINSSRFMQYITRHLARESGAYILAGGAGGEKFGPRAEGQLPYSNSEFLVSPSGYIDGQYDKMRQVPFNEYLPLRNLVRWPSWITTLQGDFKAGEKYTLFNVDGIKFSSPICWENMFPDHFRRFVKEGANFMVSVTNEGFFGRSAAPYQTLAINVFRAVENRVAIARANTTGVSAIISPKGGIVDRVRDKNGNDLFVSGIIVKDIPVSDGKTFYTVYGDIFVYIVIGVTALIFMVCLYRRNIPFGGELN